MRKTVAAFAVAICMLAGVAGSDHARSQAEGWREIAWPFPRDGWPAGRAFRCGSESCGGEIEIYVRPKAGFCNCETGVTDDEEVDRVADLDMISPRFVAREPGGLIKVAGMPGRIRAYDLDMADGARHSAVGIAVSRRCDVLVAVAQAEGAASGVQRTALEFLATADMERWMISAMGG